MKILILHQPWPMGNYKLNVQVGAYLSNLGHEVYTVEQLNGREPSPEYVDQIVNFGFDLVYFEMLDHQTFNIVEKLSCKKVLLQASGGILGSYDAITDYYGKWYDSILTNSLLMHNKFKKLGIPSVHFEFYFSPIPEDEKQYDEKYAKQCVFLGMGFNRLSDPQYELERSLYFREQSFDFNVYGNGWGTFQHYRGLLPPDDIGKLYSSATSAIGIIAKGQREHGMINNRYSEIASCGCPLISFNYGSIDWFGAEKFINFIDNHTDLQELVMKIHEDEYKEKALEFQKFMKIKSEEFFEKLLTLL